MWFRIRTVFMCFWIGTVPTAVSCKHDNKPSSSMKGGDFS
jgi:hypothetical protein